MEIEKKLSKKSIAFAELSVGDVFIWDNSVMMVVDEDYGLGERDNYCGYAIDLKTGWHYGFDDDDEVTKVSTKLIVTD